MYQNEIENEIFSKVKELSKNQKAEVLTYLEKIPKKPHSSRRYRSRALKQIKQALASS